MKSKIPQLRIIVTTRCGKSCLYCRPGGEAAHAHSSVELGLQELITLTKIMVNHGIQDIKLTGGEPLLRDDIVELVSELKAISGVRTVHLVTRHPKVTQYLDGFVKAGLDGLNFSFDSLNGQIWSQITKTKGHDKLLKAIEISAESGLDLKISSVIMAGINDHEIDNLIDLAGRLKCTLKLLDLIVDLPAASQTRNAYFDLNTLIPVLQKKAVSSDIYTQPGGLGHPMYHFVLSNGAVVLLKSSKMGAWYGDVCQNCPFFPCHDALMALRLTPDGKLQRCLLREDHSINLWRMVQGGASAFKIGKAVSQVLQTYQNAIFSKYEEIEAIRNRQVKERVTFSGRIIRMVKKKNECLLQHGLNEQTQMKLLPTLEKPNLGDIVTIKANHHNGGFLAKEIQILTPCRRFSLPTRSDRGKGVPRELTLLSNERMRDAILKRARILQQIREFLRKRKFIEIETPILTTYPSIAPVPQFTTISNTTRREYFLRICPEEHLKRMVAAGFNRVYEIGKNFRDEITTLQNLPEFTLLECYQAYANYHDMAKLTESLFETLALSILGTTQFTFRGHEIDLKTPWNRLTVNDAIQQFADIDLDQYPDAKSLRSVMQKKGIPTESCQHRWELIEQLIEIVIEPHLIQPTFLMDYPTETICVAKRQKNTPSLIERFEGYVGQMEIAHAYSESTNPHDLRQRMKKTLQQKIESGFIPHELDHDFLTALDIGLPPTGGLGVGIDRIVMLMTNLSVQNVVAFAKYH